MLSVLQNNPSALRSFGTSLYTREAEYAAVRELNLISNTVGRGLAPAEEINENKIAIGCYQIEMQTKLKAPSDEGAVVFRRKMTEGEKAVNIKFSLSLLPSRLRRATFLVRGRLYSASIFI